MVTIKWIVNNRHTDIKKCVCVWDLKQGRKKIGELWERPELWKPGNKILVSFYANCFFRVKTESQSTEEFKDEIKRYFELYLNSIQVR